MPGLRTLAITMAVALAAGTALAQDDQPERGRPGGRGFGGFGTGGYLALLQIDEVRQELSVTEEQNRKIEDIGAEFRASRPDFNRDASPEERRAQAARFREAMAAREKEVQDKLAEVLDESQMKRLRGLWVQRVGALAALSNEEIANELQLTEEQRQQLAKQREEREPQFGARGPRGEGGRPRGGEGAPPRGEGRDFAERLREARAQADEQALAVLNDDQKAAYNALKGEAFEFPAPRFGAGGGPGRGPRGGEGGPPPRRRGDRGRDAL